jgi:hypothetical protein
MGKMQMNQNFSKTMTDTITSVQKEIAECENKMQATGRDYMSQIVHLNVLLEILKEQVNHADSRHSVSQTR